jgi:exoribonuclease-2
VALERRLANGSIEIDLPEIKIVVADQTVEIRPILPLRSREVVREAMLLCGEAVAQFARREEIAMPYSTQEAPDSFEELDGLAGMYAIRRAMKRSQLRGSASPHAGLGLTQYVQATSPLRRYLDLVVHQQLRAFSRGEPTLDANEILERIGMADGVSGSIRQAERLSYRHWALVYLLQQPDWQGEGVIVDKQGMRARLLLPEVDLEVWTQLPRDLPLNSIVTVRVTSVNLPMLDLSVRVEG